MDSGTLVKLVIEAYTDSKCTASAGKSFQALINPSSMKRKLSVNLSDEPVPGSTGSPAKFKSINPETLGFQLVLDATGIIDATGENQNKTVKQLIDNFISVTVAYEGEMHEPHYAKVKWGSLEFKGRLTSCDINYTLFSNTGDPLRAKLDVSFTSIQDLETQAKIKGNTSPDLSHQVTVLEGDTLPLLCNRIYQDSSVYLQVARLNGLVNFRRLEPGTTLLFPPIK